MDSFDVKTLIFDRTQNDILEAKLLIEKIKENGFNSLSDEEKETWNIGLKACLNDTDLNRIEKCCKYFEDLFYIDNMETKTNWLKSDIPTDIEIKRILKNIETIRNLYYFIPKDTPTTPTQPLNTIEKINDVEKILYKKYIYINGNINNTNYCNDNFYSGDVLRGLL